MKIERNGCRNFSNGKSVGSASSYGFSYSPAFPPVNLGLGASMALHPDPEALPLGGIDRQHLQLPPPLQLDP
jgi:hypothetical protein